MSIAIHAKQRHMALYGAGEVILVASLNGTNPKSHTSKMNSAVSVEYPW